MRPALLLSLLGATGCGDAPALASLTSAATETVHGSTSTGLAPLTGSTTAPAPEHGTSTGDGATSTGGTTLVEPGATAGSSTGSEEPMSPPTLLDATLDPGVVTVEGPVAAHALAEHAEGVRMQVDGGAVIELDEVAPGEFAGEIGVFTALANGTHDVVFTAWKDGAESDPLAHQYEAKLNAAGSEAYWDAAGVLGAGFGRGVAIDPVDGGVYEFFDIKKDGGGRCHVRRRGAQGEYLDDDLVAVLPGKPCVATAITVDPDGALYLLAETDLNGNDVWWLGRMDSWKSSMLTLAWGGPGEEAHALAQRADEAEVAVCGTAPTNDLGDVVDGMVAIFRKDAPGYRPPPFDYRPTPDDEAHQFNETLRDCAYDGGVLVLAGEVRGVHVDEMDKTHDRLLLIEYDTLTHAAWWTVAGPGPGLAVQSGARAVAVTEEGTYLTFGFACEHACTPELHLREFLPGGVASGWNVLPAVSATLATDLAWSPAGYAVIAAGKVNGPWWTEFWLQGWRPGEEAPVWSYGHLDQPGLHIALAVAVAKFGRIYAVGVAGQGDIGVPALAIVDP